MKEDLNIFAFSAIVAVGVQVLGCIPAILLQTEKFFDLFGSIGFISTTLASLAWFGFGDLCARQWLASAAVLLWTLRLGAFLFWRVHHFGGDTRFVEMRSQPGKFAFVWFLQAVWVYVNLLPLITLLSADACSDYGEPTDYIGLVVFVLGISLEVVADVQKSRFKLDERNRGSFINTGVWSRCRHPNYVGEVMLWVGQFLMCCADFEGAQWTSVLSPVFTFLLLRFVSGVPLLAEKAQERWGNDPAFQEYLQNTHAMWFKLC
ncbi:MAG: hypothetical protein MHM6MM_000966 [Cercozoa sp. M6MM]